MFKTNELAELMPDHKRIRYHRAFLKRLMRGDLGVLIHPYQPVDDMLIDCAYLQQAEMDTSPGFDTFVGNGWGATVLLKMLEMNMIPEKFKKTGTNVMLFAPTVYRHRPGWQAKDFPILKNFQYNVTVFHGTKDDSIYFDLFGGLTAFFFFCVF